MRKLILLFLVCSALISCKTAQITGKEEITEIIVNPYFENPEIDYIYQAKINAFSKEFTGVFIAKRINENLHRVVLTSDFGNTLMDFTISENEFKVNYILEDLNKKILLKTLENDFRTLLQTKNESYSKDITNLENCYYVKKGKSILKYYFNSQTNELISIKKFKKLKEIVTFDFSENNQNQSSKIIIEHKNWPIIIQLTKQ